MFLRSRTPARRITPNETLIKTSLYFSPNRSNLSTSSKFCWNFDYLATDITNNCNRTICDTNFLFHFLDRMQCHYFNRTGSWKRKKNSVYLNKKKITKAENIYANNVRAASRKIPNHHFSSIISLSWTDFQRRGHSSALAVNLRSWKIDSRGI